MLKVFIMVSSTLSRFWRSKILKIASFSKFHVRLSDSEVTESLNRLAPTRTSSVGFKDGSIRLKNGAKLAMADSADASWVSVQVSRFSESWNHSFVSLNTSTCWTEHLVVCDLSRQRGTTVILVASLTGFTFGVMLKNHLKWGKRKVDEKFGKRK